MHKFALLLSYTGTKYSGWQRQKGSAANGDPSVQETVEEAVLKMTGEDVSVVASGRTDSGVHAMGQVAHIALESDRWSAKKLHAGLNSHLRMNSSTTIQVLGVQEVDLKFHAQRSALRKQYSYYFQQGPCALPAYVRYSWWIQKRLDLAAMQTALDALVGEHDFKPFQAADAKPGPTVRKIYEAQVEWVPIPFPGSTPTPGNPMGLVRLRLVGSGFLKQMVRRIAGTVLPIGEGRQPAQDVAEILEKMDRSKVGPTAPGRALWLEQVWYSGLQW